MRDLPPFKRRDRAEVAAFMAPLLIGEQNTEASALIDLLEYEDGHYRVLFKPSYFVLKEGQTAPTKSQWNSLKKKLKRHEATVFVFKAYGSLETEEPQYYLDFGFLPELPTMDKRQLRTRR